MDREDYLAQVRAHYRPKHSDLYKLSPDAFVPGYLKALVGGSLTSVLQEVGPGVYAFELLSARTCALLLEEVHHFEHFRVERFGALNGPNSMNRYGVILDDLGMGPSLRQLIRLCVEPLAASVYPKVEAGRLDGHHGFVVSYQTGKQVSLDFHVDDSEVTLNVCLGLQFEGGALRFRGVRCAQHLSSAPLPGEDFEVEHLPGQAILHLGRHRHEADPIRDGTRKNLILWCTSSQVRAEGGFLGECAVCQELTGT